MKLKIHNDGKGKWQSFEAWIEDIDCRKGYGSTEAEAVDEYDRELGEYLHKVTLAYGAVAAKNFETVPVDYAGKEIS